MRSTTSAARSGRAIPTAAPWSTHNRQFSDEHIRELIARGAVIGAAFDAWMIVPDWVRGTSTPENAGVTLERVIDHIDHICQIAGNARHCMIGSDLDGAFGREQCPSDVETIADLAKIPGAAEEARLLPTRTSPSIAHGELRQVPARRVVDDSRPLTPSSREAGGHSGQENLCEPAEGQRSAKDLLISGPPAESS